MTKDWQKYRSVSSDDVGVVEVNCDTEHPGQLKMFEDCDPTDPYGFYYHQQARHADLKKVMRARDEVIKTTKALTDDIRKQVDSSFTKFDKGKNRVELIEPKFIEGIGKILTFGANKYAEDNWKLMEESDERRVKGAALRHMLSYLDGDKKDSETGESHLYHAACCLMFLDYFDRTKGKDMEEITNG